MSETISFGDFQKLDIRIGRIVSAEKAEGTEKLMKMQVDFGEEKRQIVAGIAEFYTPEELAGKECPFLFNLEPKSFRGHESQGMILLAIDAEGDRVRDVAGNNLGSVRPGRDCVLLHPDKEVKPGAKVV